MCRPRKGIKRGADTFERGGDKAPFAPAAFDPLPREDDVGVFGERSLKVDPDDTPEAKQENRRIEFRLLN